MEHSIKMAIHSQNRKIFISMMLMTTILGILGTIISFKFNFGLSGTGVFLLLSGVLNFIAYFFSHKLIVKLSGAKVMTYNQAPEFFDITKELCNKNSIPMPELYLIDTEAMNAFATGRDKKHSVIAVTKGLLQKLNINEVKTVVGHELAHIDNGDMRLMTIISLVAGFISILSDIYWRAINYSKASDKDRSGVLAIIGLILSILAPISALFIQLAISRGREYVADAKSAEFTGSPLSLASALEKISRDMRPVPASGITTSHLYFSNPSNSSDFIEKLFSTHPPIKDRINKLKSIQG
ncbi:MAG TPA: protease HtpX [Spirochaetia bacterium]|nr:protease HtpX [Spirochaetia bacterium]